MEKINKNKWMNLYNLADEIYDLSLWNHLSDTEIISYVDRKTQKLYYLFVLGKGGMCKGFVIIHEDDILQYLNILENGFQPLQLLNYQTGFMITYPNKNTIEADDKIIPEKLGIGFKDEWIVFKYYEKGYLPSNLDEEKVDILTSLLENYLGIFKHVVNRDFELPLKDDMMLTRYYSDDLKGYNNVIIPKMYPDFSYEKKEFSNELINNISKLKKRPKEYEIEFLNYLPISIGDNYKDGKYKLNLYMAIADRLERKMIDFKVIESDDYMVNLEAIIKYFKENLLPNKIYVRDNLSREILLDLLYEYNIEIEVKPNLYIIDGYLSMALKKN